MVTPFLVVLISGSKSPRPVHQSQRGHEPPLFKPKQRKNEQCCQFSNDKYEKDIAIEDIRHTAFYLRNNEFEAQFDMQQKKGKKLIE